MFVSAQPKYELKSPKYKNNQEPCDLKNLQWI